MHRISDDGALNSLYAQLSSLAFAPGKPTMGTGPAGTQEKGEKRASPAIRSLICYVRLLSDQFEWSGRLGSGLGPQSQATDERRLMQLELEVRPCGLQGVHA